MTSSSPPATFRRADIQGLRAIAVLLVVTDHLLGKPSGGFIGVDIFFVISGYLITGLLLREYVRTGRISFSDFYRRRLKRTVPAAFLTIVVTVIVGYFVLATFQFSQLLQDGGWSLVFASNWWFISVGTDYLHADDAVSALQHFWSLAVEEQFYLVWPALLVAILLLAKWRGWSMRVALGTGVLLVAGLSLGWAFLETAANPTAAYFSTWSRVWELAAGAMLAIMAPLASRIPAALRTPLAWAGLGVLAAAAGVIDTSSAFPAPWAILPVLGTALILVAGEGTETRDIYPLTNPVSVYVGKISYSLYLWHFPVIIFGEALLPEGKPFFILSAALMLLLSVFSFHFVEEPLRIHTWRLPKRRATVRLRPRRAYLRPIALLAAIAVVGTGFLLAPRGDVVQAADLGALSEAAPTSALEEARAADVDAALSATSWPELTPGPADLGSDSYVSEWIVDKCLGSGDRSDAERAQVADRCVYGEPDAQQTAVLFGDSIAISYLPALRGALPDWRIEVLTQQQCPAVFVSVGKTDGSDYPGCDDYRAWAVDRITQSAPDLVVTASAVSSVWRLSSGASGSQKYDEWETGARALVDSLTPVAGHVVILDPPPVVKPIRTCATKLNGPERCVSAVSADYVGTTLAQRAAVTASGAGNVVYPYTLQWFCSTDGLCPAYTGSTTVIADGSHLSDTGSRELAPLLAPYLTVD
jgi:peptidoglycan/LPS O-acetylase OafA/YrhL/lysophospholipase L1-like esterase